MMYYVLGTIENEQHNLGWTGNKHDARDWAYFCIYQRGYETCEVVTEDGEIIAEYKRGK